MPDRFEVFGESVVTGAKEAGWEMGGIQIYRQTSVWQTGLADTNSPEKFSTSPAGTQRVQPDRQAAPAT